MTKQKIDSISKQVEIATKANQEVLPPKHVRLLKKDIPFFNNVISEFARSEWSKHQLEIAAILARTLCDLEEEQYKLRKEGSIAKTDKGTPIANPRKTIVQMHAGTILSLRKSLGVDARSQGGEKRDRDKRTAKTKEIEDAASLDDGLIATPTLH